MKYYNVRVIAYIPYPIECSYLEKASSFATAIQRAVKNYKKEPRVQRKVIRNMTVHAAMGGSL